MIDNLRTAGAALIAVSDKLEAEFTTINTRIEDTNQRINKIAKRDNLIAEMLRNIINILEEEI